MAYKLKSVKTTCYITFPSEIRRRHVPKLRQLTEEIKQASADGVRLFIFDFSKTGEIDECCADLLTKAQETIRDDDSARILVLEPSREVKEFMMDHRIGRTGEFCQSTIKDMPGFLKKTVS